MLTVLGKHLHATKLLSQTETKVSYIHMIQYYRPKCLIMTWAFVSTSNSVYQ